MKRLFSLFLALLIGLAPALSALPAGALTRVWKAADDESNLPACCRRNGKHHCRMSADQMRAMLASSSGETILTAPSCCPCYPQNLASSVSQSAALVHSPAQLSTLLVERRTPQASAMAALVSARRTWPKRGPPALSLL